MRHQIPPLPHWQVPQIHFTNPHPLQARHVQADLLAHPANLAFFAFASGDSGLDMPHCGKVFVRAFIQRRVKFRMASSVAYLQAGL